jgi:lipopolysaccharide transport system ATP-binding protein
VTKAAISIRGLTKVFRVWRHPSDMLMEALTGRLRHSEFQALSDVSLELPRGSITGIMGRNGAGKSTLLRIVAGTLDATGGSVQVNGRIAAILELGSGFHPEYSGRENVLLGGMCIGLTRQEVRARFDEIVDFAELHDFIDQPFRTYSSGMQARLTFAVATSVDADIIVIDEALSVGDARFQLKSFDRIRSFRSRGKTILLVSHDINAISSICDHAVLLERGRILREGDPNSVGNTYHELLFGPQYAAAPAPVEEPAEAAAAGNGQATDASSEQQAQLSSEPDRIASEPDEPVAGACIEAASGNGAAAEGTSAREHRYGLGNAYIKRVQVLNGKLPVTELRSLSAYSIAFTIEARKDTGPLHAGILVRTPRGITILGWDSWTAGLVPLAPFRAGETRVVKIGMRANLAPGRYFLTATIAQPDTTKEDVRFDVLEFTVGSDCGLHTDSVVNLEIRYDPSDL